MARSRFEDPPLADSDDEAPGHPPPPACAPSASVQPGPLPTDWRLQAPPGGPGRWRVPVQSAPGRAYLMDPASGEELQLPEMAPARRGGAPAAPPSAWGAVLRIGSMALEGRISTFYNASTRQLTWDLPPGAVLGQQTLTMIYNSLSFQPPPPQPLPPREPHEPGAAAAAAASVQERGAGGARPGGRFVFFMSSLGGLRSRSRRLWGRPGPPVRVAALRRWFFKNGIWWR